MLREVVPWNSVFTNHVDPIILEALVVFILMPLFIYNVHHRVLASPSMLQEWGFVGVKQNKVHLAF
jgi:hypothetical protein